MVNCLTGFWKQISGIRRADKKPVDIQCDVMYVIHIFEYRIIVIYVFENQSSFVLMSVLLQENLRSVCNC